MNKKQLIIIQDTREPEMQLLADLNNMNIEFKKEMLKVGDYIFGDMIIERKEIDDFACSILDGRLKSQIEDLKAWRDSGRECFIIVVGRIKDRKSEINENCILGKMVSIVLKHNIKMLFVDDEFQFIYVLKNLCEKYLELKEKI